MLLSLVSVIIAIFAVLLPYIQSEKAKEEDREINDRSTIYQLISDEIISDVFRYLLYKDKFVKEFNNKYCKYDKILETLSLNNKGMNKYQIKITEDRNGDKKLEVGYGIFENNNEIINYIYKTVIDIKTLKTLLASKKYKSIIDPICNNLKKLNDDYYNNSSKHKYHSTSIYNDILNRTVKNKIIFESVKQMPEYIAEYLDKLNKEYIKDKKTNQIKNVYAIQIDKSCERHLNVYKENVNLGVYIKKLYVDSMNPGVSGSEK